MTPAQLIERCRENGIELWAKPGNKIGYRPKSLMTQRVAETIQKHKAKLLPLLPLVADMPIASSETPEEPPQTSYADIPADIIALGAEIDAELLALEESIFDEAVFAAMNRRMPVFDSLTQKGVTLTPGTTIYNPGGEFLRCGVRRKQALGRLNDPDADLSTLQRVWQEERVAQAQEGMDRIAFWWWLFRKDSIVNL